MNAQNKHLIIPPELHAQLLRYVCERTLTDRSKLTIKEVVVTAINEYLAKESRHEAN